jgi:hypothetical protein
MKSFLHVIGVFITFFVSPVYAVQCAAPGAVNVLKAIDGSGFIFYPSRSYGDTVFVLPGKEFHKDTGAPLGTTQFEIDGIHFQFLTTAKSQFVAPGKLGDDATVLAKHVAYEHKYAVSNGSPLREVQELGNRTKPADEHNPEFVFKLWLLKDPKQPDGVRQYFLTTVVGGEVAVLSAIVLGPQYEQQAISAFTKFASSLQFVPSEKACPSSSVGSGAQPFIPPDLSRQAAPVR